MKVFTNKEINEIKLIMPDLNFGQTNDIPENKLLNYELEVDAEEFFHKCKPFFEEIRQLEMEEQDEELTEAIWQKYKALNFPALEYLFEKEKKLLQEIICFYNYEFLHELVKPNRTKNKEFALLLDLAHTEVNETILFEGKCVIVSNE